MDGDDAINPLKVEWIYACSAGGTRVYPYGDTYDPNACITEKFENKGRQPVRSAPGCEGGFPGLFDMSGNVEEWTDRTIGGVGARGGAAGDPSVYSRCDTVVGVGIDGTTGATGFRCCKDGPEQAAGGGAMSPAPGQGIRPLAGPVTRPLVR